MNKVNPPLRRLTLGVVIASLLLGGCSSIARHDYERPAMTLPGAWLGPVDGKTVAASDRWWTAFQDPVLTDLIDQALLANNDLAAAAISVRKARLQAGLTATNLTPDVSVGASASASKPLDGGNSSRDYGTSVQASYSLDLWGKLAAARDADRWEAEATEEDRQASALSLIGTVAELYWQIAYLNQSIANGEASLAYTRQTLALVKARRDAGSVSQLELVQAERSVATQEQSLLDLRQQRIESQHALAILFDQPPKIVIADDSLMLSNTVPSVAPGIPADVLGNRPDLRAAELRLKETLAQGDVTRASYYPDLTLTTSLGTGGDQLSEIVKNPVGTLAASLALPFVEWNSMQLESDMAEADYQKAVVEFRQSLYSALSDVENALSANVSLKAQGDALNRALELAKQGEKLAEIRYRSGATTIDEWLDEQETRRTAELSAAANQQQQLNNMMSLYQALGGPVTRYDLAP